MAEEAGCWCVRFERGEVWKMWDGEGLEHVEGEQYF